MNWFHKMMLLLLAFISMLMYFTIRSVNAPLPLVTEKYYEEELKYQDKIEKLSNAEKMKQQIDITASEGKLKIKVPDSLNVSEIKGNVKMYYPADEKRDRNIPLSIASGNTQEIDLEGIKGNYTIEVDWTYGDHHFLTEKKIFF